MFSAFEHELYVYACETPGRQEGWFEVIAGRSALADGAAKCFAFVHRYGPKPKRRLYETLKSQDMQFNQPVTFLSDSGETVRDLSLYVHPYAEHVLDWFHVTILSFGPLRGRTDLPCARR